MKMSDRFAHNRTLEHQVRERAYRETWDRPRWADGSPMPTDRPAPPVPAAAIVPPKRPEPQHIAPGSSIPADYVSPPHRKPEPPPFVIDEALARLAELANGPKAELTDPHGGTPQREIINTRRNRPFAYGRKSPGEQMQLISVANTDALPRAGTPEATEWLQQMTARIDGGYIPKPDEAHHYATLKAGIAADLFAEQYLRVGS